MKCKKKRVAVTFMDWSRELTPNDEARAVLWLARRREALIDRERGE